MPGIPPIEGVVAYDFREAINALACSTADAAALAASWFDLCDMTEEKMVEVHLSNGRTMLVPNLAKALASVQKQGGDITATSFAARGPYQGSKLTQWGLDVGSASGSIPSGEARTQHAYKTPYNEFYDACYLSSDTSTTVSFLALPRIIFFTGDPYVGASGLGPDGYHKLSVRPIPNSAKLLETRADKKGVCIATMFTIMNADLSRTAGIAITGDQGGMSVTQSFELRPGESKTLIAYGWRGADACNIVALREA